MKRWLLLSPLVLFTGLPANHAEAYSAGVLSNILQANGCNGCHNGGTAPQVAISGPSQVLPGQTVDYTFTVNGTGNQRKAGFIVLSNDGTLETDDTKAQTILNNKTGRNELTHVAPAEAATAAVFTFRWTAPASFTTVTLTAWGNAVNGDGGSVNDQATQTTLTISPCPDADGDGALAKSCGGEDCDDSSQASAPGRTEVCGDGIDQDCSGADLTCSNNSGDEDGDGQTLEQGDCDDEDDAVYTGADEVPYDGVDQDCDGVDLTDIDADGSDGGPGGADCDDEDEDVAPTALEVCGDSKDNDCDGKKDESTDNDGDGSAARPCGGDCDDTNVRVYPGATEEADALDNDCDGVVDERTDAYDDDHDGYTENQDDCNDANSAMNPGETEICGDGIDQDCNGADLSCGETFDPDQKDDDEGGCAHRPGGGSSGLAGLSLALIAGLVVARRRRA